MKVLIGSAGALLALIGLASPAWADGEQPGPLAAPGAVFGGAASLGSDELGAIAGQADLNLQIRADNSSYVSNNTVSGNSQTGTIGFDSNAFQNLNGLAVVSANTGNNVSINSSLNVNVALNP